MNAQAFSPCNHACKTIKIRMTHIYYMMFSNFLLRSKVEWDQSTLKLNLGRTSLCAFC